MSNQRHTDEQLMNRVSAGEVDPLAELFERHHRALFRFLQRLSGATAVAEDLVQEVFFRVLRFRGTFQPDSSFRPWMYRIARNVYADHVRKHRGETPLELPTVAAGERRPQREFVDPVASPELALVRSSDLAVLQRAFEQLPPERRELLLLSRWQGLPYEEIATILQCEPGAVKTRVFRAMRQLGEAFFQMTGPKPARRKLS